MEKALNADTPGTNEVSTQLRKQTLGKWGDNQQEKEVLQ
jgi:hypothetical protein